MAQKHLHLKGYVGGYDFDSDYVDYILAKYPDSEVNVLIDSLGGSLATALSIVAAFRNHGNVHVHFVGMNASAATIASMGAKRITMDSSAMYLVHKCSVEFFEWASANSDKLAEIIKEARQMKSDLEKMDLNVAQLYASKCQKNPEDLLALMKKGGWLTAQEAKEYGFVDEITSFEEDEAPVITDSVAADMTASGIPVPSQFIKDEGQRSGLFSRFVESLAHLFSSEEKIEPQTSNFKFQSNTPNTETEMENPNTPTQEQQTVTPEVPQSDTSQQPSAPPVQTSNAAKENEKLVLQNQIAYMQGLKNYDEYIKASQEEDRRYYEDVTTSTQIGETDRLKLKKEYLEKLSEYENKRRSKSLQEVEDEYKQLNLTAMQSYVDGKLNKEEYEETLSRLELEQLDKRRNVLSEQVELMKEQNQAGSQQYEEACRKYAEANKEYLDKVIVDQEAKAKKAKEIEEKELEERERMLREHSQSLQSIRDEYFGMNTWRAKQEYDAMMKLLEEQKAIELAEVANLENADAEKLSIEEAYQKARLALAKKYNQMQEEDGRNFMQKWNDSVKEFFESELGKSITSTLDVVTSSMKNIFTQLTTIITAEAEIETAKVESLYDQRISLAEGNNYKVVRYEKEKEEKIAKIKNEAEKKKYKMEVISAIAQTAQGAINAYSSAAAIPLVGYIIAPIAAAAAIAAGMLQVQALKKQQQASEAQGYAEGGFTPEGLPDTPVGIVHAGEWVASQRLTKNRRIRPILEALDTAQRTNKVGSLSEDYVTKTITAPTVLAESFKDYRQAPKKVIVKNPSPIQPQQNDKVLSDYAETMRLLRQRLDEPFVTVNSVTGDIGMKQAQDEYAKLIRNKTPKSRL